MEENCWKILYISFILIIANKPNKNFGKDLKVSDSCKQKSHSFFANGFFGNILLLLLTHVLFSLFIANTCLSAISCCATNTIHCTTETYSIAGLIFFHEAACSRTQPISAVVPAATFNYS